MIQGKSPNAPHRSQRTDIKKHFLAAAVCSFFGRIPYARNKKAKYLKKLKEAYGIDISIGKLSLSSFRSFRISRFAFTYKNYEVTAANAVITVNPRALLRRQLKVVSLNISLLEVKQRAVLVQPAGVPDRKIPAAFGKNRPVSPDRIKRYLRTLARYLPQTVSVQELNTHIRPAGIDVVFKADKVMWNHNRFSAALSMYHQGKACIYDVEALQEEPRSWTARCTRQPQSETQIFFFMKGVSFSLSGIKIRAKEKESIDRAAWNVECAADGFEIAAINSGDHLLEPSFFRAAFDLSISNSAVMLECTSAVFNRVPFSCTCQYEMNEQTVGTSFKFSGVSLSDFLSSIGKLNIEGLGRIPAQGTLSLSMDFSFALLNPLRYKFSASFDQSQFEIMDLSCVNIEHLNDPFIYSATQHDGTSKQILVSDANPDFVSINEISEQLLKVILSTEDPNFLLHTGVFEDAIGFALASNLAAGKFKRGGSTITMQLVRNLFLHHRKTPARKLEEMVIAWLLEEYVGLSKERILELYLNIIELGPGIYGIKPASYYYFGKHPNELTLLECIVLSYVIPRPRFFPEAVQMRSPQLLKNLGHHISRYREVMKIQGVESEDEGAQRIAFASGLGVLEW